MCRIPLSVTSKYTIPQDEHESRKGYAPAILGGGLALILPAMTEAAISHAPKAQSGIAAGMLNESRQVGGVIGAAILGAFVSNQQTFLSGMHLAFVIAGGVLVLALVAACIFVRTPA